MSADAVFIFWGTSIVSGTLSMRRVVKANEPTGHLQKSVIGLSELVPADQQATRAKKPGEKPLDDPSSRRFARLQAVGVFLGRLIPCEVLLIEPDMRLIAALVRLAMGS